MVRNKSVKFLITILFLLLATKSAKSAKTEGLSSLWMTMPDAVKSELAKFGISEESFQKKGEEYGGREFKDRVRTILSKEEVSEPTKIYLNYFLGVCNYQPDPKREKWLINLSERKERLNYLNEALSLAEKEPMQFKRLILNIFSAMEQLYLRDKNWQAVIEIRKKGLERYYDGPVPLEPEGLTANRAVIAKTIGLFDLFIRANVPKEEALSYLKGISENHPHREIRCAALLSLAYFYYYYDEYQEMERVVSLIQKDYQDLRKVFFINKRIEKLERAIKTMKETGKPLPMPKVVKELIRTGE